jgi:hypothetical protein
MLLYEDRVLAPLAFELVSLGFNLGRVTQQSEAPKTDGPDQLTRTSPPAAHLHKAHLIREGMPVPRWRWAVERHAGPKSWISKRIRFGPLVNRRGQALTAGSSPAAAPATPRLARVYDLEARLGSRPNGCVIVGLRRCRESNYDA